MEQNRLNKKVKTFQKGESSKPIAKFDVLRNFLERKK